MRTSLWIVGCALLAAGCTPLSDMPEKNTLTPAAVVSSSPTAVAVAVHTPKPAHSKTPSIEMLHPDVPPAATARLKPLAVLKPAMVDSEVWWADSGIRDNGLDYYASDKDAKTLEAELTASMGGPDFKPYIAELGPVFDFQGMRVSVLQKDKSDFARMFVIAPLGDPPAIPEGLRKLKLPNIDLKSVSADLKGKQTLVILASGRNLGEAVDHSMAEAGLSVTATPMAPTGSATP